MAIHAVATQDYEYFLSGGAGGRPVARDTNGRIYVVYNKTPNGYSDEQIYCTYSDDYGVSWTVEQVTDVDTTEDAISPAIATDSLGRAHLIYGREDDSGRNRLYYRRRDTNGSWTEREEVNGTGSDYRSTSFVPSAIAIDSDDTVHVVWKGYIGSRWRYILYRAKSGDTWGDVGQVTPDTGVSQKELVDSPSIAIDSGNNVHVVWSGKAYVDSSFVHAVSYRQKTGEAWLTKEIVASTDGSKDQWGVQCDLDNHDDVHVAWAGEGWGTNTTDFNIQYRKREGGVWQSQEAITDTDSEQWFPGIAVTADKVIHIVWQNLGTSVIYHKQKVTAWGDADTITRDVTLAQRSPHLLGATYPAGAKNYGTYFLLWESGSAGENQELLLQLPGSGFLWGELTRDSGKTLCYISGKHDRMRILGGITGSSGTAGFTFVEGSYLNYLDANGDERRRTGYLTGGAGTAGVIKAEPDTVWLYYVDSSSRVKKLGTWILGSSMLGIDTILHA